MPAGYNDVCTFSYVGRYDDKSPKGALGMFRSRIRRAWGHAAVFAWSDLVLDRSRKLVGLQSPAACRGSTPPRMAVPLLLLGRPAGTPNRAFSWYL